MAVAVGFSAYFNDMWRVSLAGTCPRKISGPAISGGLIPKGWCNFFLTLSAVLALIKSAP